MPSKGSNLRPKKPGSKYTSNIPPLTSCSADRELEQWGAVLEHLDGIVHIYILMR